MLILIMQCDSLEVGVISQSNEYSSCGDNVAVSELLNSGTVH